MDEASNWRTRAKCRTQEAEKLFLTGREQRQAKIFCESCPVRTECLAFALDERMEFGVWGGMTERERRALLMRRPEVRSWLALLRSARSRHSRLRGADRGPASAQRLNRAEHAEN